MPVSLEKILSEFKFIINEDKRESTCSFSEEISTEAWDTVSMIWDSAIKTADVSPKE